MKPLGTDEARPTMPVLFAGQGNPLLTLGDNRYTRGWRALAETLPEPRAILAMSAHWFIPETSVTAMPVPPTIHDFHGFPDELFRIEYPAAGSPALAEQVADLLAPAAVGRDQDWGIDHGTWSVLRHLYPRAHVPVVQLSLDLRKSPEEHFRLGRQLAALRDDGILIFASGNVVHNLAGYDWRNPDAAPPEWTVAFENWNREQLAAGRPEALADYHAWGAMADRSAPSPDHYLPLLYLAALQLPSDRVDFPVEGFDGGTMSMLSVVLRDKNQG